MDDPEALRQRAQEQLDHIDEMLAQRRQERAGATERTPPAAEAPKPAHRATAPRERPPPAPPAPDKITRIQHDDAGRISATEAYSGTAAVAARSWQGYIEDRIGAQILDFAKEFGGGIGEVLAEMRTAEREATAVHLAALEARIAMLEERLADEPEKKRYAAAAD